MMRKPLLTIEFFICYPPIRRRKWKVYVRFGGYALPLHKDPMTKRDAQSFANKACRIILSSRGIDVREAALKSARDFLIRRLEKQ